MSCNFTEKISLFIDGELSPSEARQGESHLVTCLQCAEARADFLHMSSQIAYHESSLAPTVQNRALAKFLSPRSRERTAPGSGLRWGLNWGYGAAALGFALVVLVAITVFLIPSKRPQQVALNGPASAPSPTPAATVEPSKPDNTHKETETQRRQQPVRTVPARPEPKPAEPSAAPPRHPVRRADAQTMTALHLERAETLLRAFRNVRLDEPGSSTEV